MRKIPTISVDLRGNPIHDIRVALKRMRVLVKLLTRYQNSSPFMPLFEELREKSRHLALVRDQQIITCLLQAYAQEFDPDKLAILKNDNPQQDIEAKILGGFLGLQKSARCLRKHTHHFPWKKNACREASHLYQRIDKKYQQLKKREDPRLFHQLRKDVKTLDYLADFGLIRLHHPHRSKILLQSLGKNLGKLHDLYLLLEKLPYFSKQVDGDGICEEIEKKVRQELRGYIQKNFRKTQKLLRLA